MDSGKDSGEGLGRFGAKLGQVRVAEKNSGGLGIELGQDQQDFGEGYGQDLGGFVVRLGQD